MCCCNAPFSNLDWIENIFRSHELKIQLRYTNGPSSVCLSSSTFSKKYISKVSQPILVEFHVKHHQGLGIGCIRFFVPNINPANQAPGFQTGLAQEIKNFHRLIMGFFLVKIFFSETKRPLAYIFNIYCAYRNSVNIAFLRLFRFVGTDRTMTIRI